MSHTMPLDSRNIEALHLLTLVEQLEALDLESALRIEFHPGQEEPYRIRSHRCRTLSEVLEKLLQELG